ncbi:MAG: hypothetical protein IT289_04110 [Oligoflexia bacterium]|nr:hypothetical protein [Oligoflexia bacterium]
MFENEDFEFKPITDGLGFHKKSLELRDDQIGEASLPLKTGILPQKNPNIAPRPEITKTKAAPATGKWKPSLGHLQMTETPTPVKSTAPVQGELKPLTTNWAASLFDAAMVVGLTLIFSTVVFAMTAIEFEELIQLLSEESGARIATAVLLISVLEIYAVACRSFFGKSLGEFECDSRLGAPHQAQSMMYPLMVAWRTLIVALTGFVTLPILSSLTGTDIPGKISGVSLYRETT